MKQAPAIGFRYRASRLLIATTLAVAELAIAAVWISAAPRGLCMFLTMVVVVCAGASLGRMLRSRVRAVLWRADGGVEVQLNAGVSDSHREVQGAIHAARIMGPLIVLALRWPSRGRATLWLLPDNLDADTRRRLRMRLQFDERQRLRVGERRQRMTV